MGPLPRLPTTPRLVLVGNCKKNIKLVPGEPQRQGGACAFASKNSSGGSQPCRDRLKSHSTPTHGPYKKGLGTRCRPFGGLHERERTDGYSEIACESWLLLLSLELTRGDCQVLI